MEKGTIIAITGQSGCGKSTLSQFYRSMGYTVVDCDKVAASVRDMPRCRRRLGEHFGYDVVKKGQVDKALLTRRAFSSPENLQKLTDITHPFIIEEILNQANTAFEKGEKFVFVDGAVIIGHDFEKYCQKFIVVVAQEKILCRRLSQRDGISLQKAKERISAQTPYSKMLEKADYVINNNTDVPALIRQASLTIRQIDK